MRRANQCASAEYSRRARGNTHWMQRQRRRPRPPLFLRHGQGMEAFLVTLIAFFFAEMGDKTQIATAMLAAKYDALVTVVAGTTLGMLCADLPAVLLGNAVRSLPFRAVRLSAAALFVALGAAVLLGHFALA